MTENEKALKAFLDRFADIQLETAGLVPRMEQPPAVVPLITSLTAMQVTTSAVQVSGDRPFIALAIQAWSAGPFSLNVRASSLPAKLSENLIHSYALFGNPAAPRPFRLPRPWLLDRTATLTFELTDLSNAVNAIGLAVVGYRSPA